MNLDSWNVEVPVIIDLGSRFCKVGFVGEAWPRKIVPTIFKCGSKRKSKPYPYQKFKEGEIVSLISVT